MSSSAQRVPPHSIEAEQSVLGSMLLDANAVTQAMETLTTEDFYTPAIKRSCGHGQPAFGRPAGRPCHRAGKDESAGYAGKRRRHGIPDHAV
ncbi:MAG: DnaB-like helicase N-terminal domain-containing protein [Christensenellales bacterium]